MPDAGPGQALVGRRVLVAVCGGIAAYKVCTLVSRLVQAGAQVRVMMTPAATQFVGPVTFRSLTGHPVAVDMWTDLPESGDHVALAQFAELVVVAPATANTLAKLAVGLGDNLVTTTLAAVSAPVLLAPAMHTRMWDNPATQANVALLQARGYHFLLPEAGRLACGTVGVGRMAEPETLLAAVKEAFRPPAGPLAGKRVLVTAGPTREWLDPVRFLSNPATGRMGMALAQVAAQRGAQVTLVLGPTALTPPPGVEVVGVETAQEMHKAILARLPGTAVFLAAAAVADYRPEAAAEQKEKKTGAARELRLVPTPDILQAVADSPQRPAVVVGFAAETQALEDHAREKLQRKGLDLIVANDVTRPGAGFAVETNEVLILDRAGGRQALSCRPKLEVAATILDRVEALLG